MAVEAAHPTMAACSGDAISSLGHSLPFEHARVEGGGPLDDYNCGVCGFVWKRASGLHRFAYQRRFFYLKDRHSSEYSHGEYSHSK